MQQRQIEDPDWVLEEYISLRERFFADKPDDYEVTQEDEKRFKVFFEANASTAIKQYHKQRKMMSA